jgi:hypothetical protein
MQEEVWKVRDGVVGRWGVKGTGGEIYGKREDAGWSWERKGLDGGKMGREKNLKMGRGKMQYGVRKGRDGTVEDGERMELEGEIGRGKMQVGVWKGRSGAVG